MLSSSQTSSTATPLPPSFLLSSSSRSPVKTFTFGVERKVGCLAMKSDDVYGEIPNVHRIVQVPRQKYIPVPKAELLDAIVAAMFASHCEALQFIDVSVCLDSILHAEHKTILEEMRADYSIVSANFMGRERSLDDTDADSSNSASIPTDVELEGYVDVDVNSGGGESISYKQFSSIFRRELENLFNFPVENVGGVDEQPRQILTTPVLLRLANASRFQRTFMQLLRDAQFEELSARDLMLVSALNTDYLLTLPIFVDWKKASQSNAIIFRRGYATEKQKGLLLAEKLDYIQSRLLRGIFFIISKPLANVGSWIAEKLKSTDMYNELEDQMKKLKNWLSEVSDFPKSYLPEEDSGNNDIEEGSALDQDLPIWFAAQRAVTSYKQLLSSAGPRGRLLGKLLTWAGLSPPAPETQFELQEDDTASEPYLRPNFLSRIALNDLWRPAREKWYSDSWEAFKTAVSILFSPSALQEAAFQELILLYTTEVDEKDSDSTSRSELQLKIYERIPIPDLPVIFPHKKLSFRIIDTVRLDAATVLGLLAYFINYKFEDVSSSPSAIVLDAIAITALIVVVTRVVLGYKQTWDRYELLVNKTLYEKTLASGFGSIHFLLDASEQQQYKEAILAYAILLGSNNNQVKSRRSVGDECERFIYNVFKQKVEMAVEKAIDTLLRLGLATETPGSGVLEAIPCPKAHETLRQRWDTLLSSSQTTVLKHN